PPRCGPFTTQERLDQMTFQDLAREAAGSFEVRTRDSGERYTATREDAPEWVGDLVHHAHGGDLLPDDWRYQAISAALDFIAEYDSADDARDACGEFADGHVDVYTGARFAWLASNLGRADYVDRALEDGLADASAGIVAMIGVGQYVESEEVFALVLDALEA